MVFCSDKYRAENALKPTKEDTLEVARQMRASSPPANTADMLENQMPKRNRPFRRVRTNEQIAQEVVTHTRFYIVVFFNCG